MTNKSDRTLIESYEATDHGARELAAAESAAQAARLIDEALDASGLSQKALASSLGVTEGRVSQIVNGDGNVRVSALGRLLHELGYELRMSATPRTEKGSLPELPRQTRRQRRSSERLRVWDTPYLQGLATLLGERWDRVDIAVFPTVRMVDPCNRVPSVWAGAIANTKWAASTNSRASDDWDSSAYREHHACPQ